MSGRQDVTRRIEPGILEIDFESSALIINYNINAEVIDGNGKVLKSKSEDKQKVVSLDVDEHTDIEDLAESIVHSQKYIPAAKIDRVVKLLGELQDYVIKHSRRRSSKKSSKRDKKHSSKKSSRRSKKESVDVADAKDDGEGKEDDGGAPKKELECDIDSLDEYLDNLYSEDFAVKTLGVRKIVQLAKNDPTNLEEFIENEPLMGALSRVLQDDYKQNYELTVPLCSLFCIFSKFSDMHLVLCNKAIGTMAIKILELEISRYDLRFKKMKEYRKAVETGKRDQAFLDAEEKKTQGWLVKNENLLSACVRLLLNLSEDVDIERKMCQKTDLLKYLVSLLGRHNSELLKVTMVFLKKLSIVLENSIKLTDCGIVKALMPYVPFRADPYISYNGLKLLLNLSFSPLVRKQIAELDGVKNVVAFLPNTRTRTAAIKVLYNLSTDGSCRESFAASDCLTSVIKLCLMNKNPQTPAPLGSLCVNLLLDPQNARKVCNSKAHAALMKKFLETRDIFLAKCAKTLSLYTYRVQEALGEEDDYEEIEIWGAWIKELFAMAMEIHQEGNSPDLLVEILATLSNMSPDDLPEDMMWKDLLEMGRCQVLEFMEELCDSRIPSARPDVVMQAICCVGAFALEPDVCAFLAEHRPRLFRLIQLDLHFYTEDAGITLQILFVLYRLLRFQEVCVEMLSLNSNSFSGADIQKFVATVGEFVDHPHAEIQRCAHALLDLVMEFDSVQGTGQLFALAREVKFSAQNQDWIEIMDEFEQNKRFVIEERGTVVNDGEDLSPEASDSEGSGYIDANMDSGDYAE
eukprot:INCI1327.2.p1 GENE.INCI1327.2~~INCI1327.2.p1  ORF type:complete len:803 (+),score=183.58 INCI1327.2:163-2571(+)